MDLNNPLACSMDVSMDTYYNGFPNIYIKLSTHMFVILGFYVYDSILVFNNIPFFNTTKMDLFQAFNMTNNGEFHYCL
jgi:hypothetical protein